MSVQCESMTDLQQAEFLLDAAERENDAAQHSERAHQIAESRRHRRLAQEFRLQADLIFERFMQGPLSDRAAG